MPLSPTPPKGSSGTARCSQAWFTVTPPDEVRAMNCSATSLSPANTYSASGFSRRLMKVMASSGPLTLSTGRMGPKISSAITGESGATFLSTVGAR